MPLARFANLPEPRRAAILDAALEEFAFSGFEGASFNRILERAGVSKGAIYYYFADKEDLYLTVLERALAALATDVPPFSPVADAAAFWAEVTRLYASMVAVVRRDPRVVRLAQRAAGDLVRLTQTERLAPLMASATATVGTVLQSGIAVGAVRTDLPADLLLDLTLSVGQAVDRYSMASGELGTDAGSARTIERGMDLLRRLLTPAQKAEPPAPRGPRGARAERGR